MSNYYNPKRSASWNYGGDNWKLSRSKIDLYLECPRCFYIDNKLGTKRPPGYPFNLNSAVDELLKKEFDIHRAEDKQHPLQEEYDIDARPVAHEQLNDWRNWKAGVQVEHEDTGMTVSGAIDDLWIDADDEFVVVDYKATSKNGEVSLDADWQITYKRQMEVYQWLLRNNGLSVSNTGYFVYCNGITDIEAFDGKLEFDISLIAYEGDDNWVDTALNDIHACLESDTVPEADEECDYCAYFETRKEVVGERTGAHKSDTQTLFD